MNALLSCDTTLAQIPRRMLQLVEEADRDSQEAMAPQQSTGRDKGPNGLTRREREVLILLSRGISNKEIGIAIFPSDHTVERHISNIYRKLDIRRRAEASVFAERHGLT